MQVARSLTTSHEALSTTRPMTCVRAAPEFRVLLFLRLKKNREADEPLPLRDRASVRSAFGAAPSRATGAPAGTVYSPAPASNLYEPAWSVLSPSVLLKNDRSMSPRPTRARNAATLFGAAESNSSTFTVPSAVRICTTVSLGFCRLDRAGSGPAANRARPSSASGWAKWSIGRRPVMRVLRFWRSMWLVPRV